MKSVRKKYKRFWNLACCMLFYLLFIIILYILWKEFGLLAALAVTEMSYRFMVLAIATNLRMRGDITERSFIRLVLEGFKTTSLFKKIGSDSVSVKPDSSSRTKKS